MTEKNDPTLRADARLSPLIVTGVIALSFVGLFVGIHANAQRDVPLAGVLHHPSPASPPSFAIVPSMTYAQMREQRHGPNAEFRSELSRLRPPSVDPTADLGQDPQARLVSLAQRADRRAYNGAPPTVPHPIDQLSASSCLLCHGEGLRIGDSVAHKMPHEAYASCTQCHVEQRDRDPIAINSFDGVPAPFAGDRAWPGAPPTVPHTLAMRSDCLSCHGPAGRPGMRTSHPERTSCLQCHAPSARLNQSPSAGAVLFLRDVRGMSP